MTVKQRILEYLDLEIAAATDFFTSIAYEKVKEFINHLEDESEAPTKIPVFTYKYNRDQSTWDVIVDSLIGWVSGKVMEDAEKIRFSVTYSNALAIPVPLGDKNSLSEAKGLIEYYHIHRSLPSVVPIPPKPQMNRSDFNWTITQKEMNFSDLEAGDFIVEEGSLRNDDVWMVKEAQYLNKDWKVNVISVKNVLSGAIKEWVCSGRTIIHKVDRIKTQEIKTASVESQK